MITLRNLVEAASAVAILSLAAPLQAADTLHLSLVSSSIDNEYGYSVDSIGDVNGDGFDDVLVGIPRDAEQGSERGAVLLISGADGSTLRRVEGNQDDERFGHSVASIADISGDGIEDFVVGAPMRDFHGTDAGVARVYSGADATQLFLLFELAGDEQRFGWAVEDAGDVDNDGTTDIIIGAPYTDQPKTLRAGAAYVFSGATGLRISAFAGNQAFAFLGHDVVGLGDVNGDSKSDLLVGLPGLDNLGVATNSGRVFVYDGDTGISLYGISGNSGDEFGRSLDVVGDLNSDGVNDYAVAAWGRDGASLELGAVTIYNGATGAALGPPILGQQRAELSGTSVAGVGDVNGDSVPDIAVGSFAYDAFGIRTSSGIVRVYSGTDSSVIFEVAGDTKNHRLGWATAGGGDFNNDGRMDVIMGAPQRPFEPTDNARVLLYLDLP